MLERHRGRDDFDPFRSRIYYISEHGIARQGVVQGVDGLLELEEEGEVGRS